MADWGDFKSKLKPNTSPGESVMLTGRCTYHHPALVIPNTNGLVIYGGSCSHPAQTDCDVYVGLDWGYEPTPPWDTSGPLRAHYQITDMQAPKDPASFKRMIKWLDAQLHAGRKCHVGCIGGHGRTGMVLAALVATHGEADALRYVREHYCQKAVETHEQVAFLCTHFGVVAAPGAKEGRRRDPFFDDIPSGIKRATRFIGNSAAYDPFEVESATNVKPPKLRAAKKDRVKPLAGYSIFGDNLK